MPSSAPPPLPHAPFSHDATVARAPGRVNLIGEHTDYQDGFCVPIAIDRTVETRFVVNDEARIRVRSDALDGVVDVAADGSDDAAAVEPAWGRIVAAVARELQERGREPIGIDADTTSTVPVGSGLSSSAAFAVSIALALSDAAGSTIDRVEIARVAQAAEQRATGVPCGLLDQLSSVLGVADHALLLDCRTMTVEPVALPADLGVVVVHSGLPRTLAGSEYRARREACEAAAARLGVVALRDATIDQVVDDPIARHVVSENARALHFVEALRRADADAAGQLMLASHRSLADDFRVSTPELDLLVDELMAAGALGARLTGAGFGGCCIAIGAHADTEAIAHDAATRYAHRTGLTPLAFCVHAVDGAHIVRH